MTGRDGFPSHPRVEMSARVGRADADSVARATRNAQAALLAAARRPCTCTHPASDHERDEGCLHGWGKPPATGCTCEGTPA